MLDREDITAIARGATGAIRQVLHAFETRLGLLEKHASAGIKDITIRNHEKDRRLFIQTVVLTDGREIESSFKIVGSMQYREIYQVGRQYEIGDVVTHDGAMWVAIRDTMETPGKSSNWRLAVKRGQNGSK